MALVELATLPGRGIKPLVSLAAHRQAALLAFVLILILGLPLVLIKGEVYYNANALVQVAPRYMKNLRDDGELDFPSNTQYREFLQQQTRSVNRYDIVRDALQTLGSRAGPWRRPDDSERKAVDRLRAALQVRAVPDTYMIEISLQGKDKAGLAEVVNAIVETYVERMRGERVFGAEARIRSLEERQDLMLRQIRQHTEQRTQLALELGIATFSGKEENPYNKLLGELRATLAEARAKRQEAEAQLKAFENHGETDLKTRSIQEAVLIDPGLNNLKANLFKRRADLLIQLSGLQPAHPAYGEAQGELQRIDQELATQTGKLQNQVKLSLQTRFRTAVEQARRYEGDLQEDVAAMEKKGGHFAAVYNQALQHEHDIEQLREELDAIRKRLNHFAAEQNSFGFVRLLNPALPPEQPYGPGKKKILLLVLLLAGFGALAIPILIDLTDRRVQTVNDAERLMQIPALGWLVEHRDDASREFATDQLRRIAGSLIEARRKGGQGILALSSIKPGGGASQLVLDLARTLSTLGYPSLAVEANAFHSDQAFSGIPGLEQRLQALFGAQRAPQRIPGLADCLRGDASPDACIVTASANLPDRVGIGQTGGRMHLERSDRITEVCAEWSKNYPFILLDLPPLLLSADAEILTRRVGQLLLVVEAGGVETGELRRAARLLEKLELNAAGMIVNRVRPFNGGGYLQGAILEYLSGRKLADYYSTPAWRLNLDIAWTRLQLRHRWLATPLRQLAVWSGSLLLLASLLAAAWFLARHPATWLEFLLDPTHDSRQIVPAAQAPESAGLTAPQLPQRGDMQP